MKSFDAGTPRRARPPMTPNPTVDFHGENDTHQSTTVRRRCIGRAYLGHVLLDNRHGLVANVCATHATGTAEREAAALLLEASAPPGSTVGARATMWPSPMSASGTSRPTWRRRSGSATTRHAGYHVSQRKRQVFGWMKTVGGLRKLRHRGVPLVDWQLTFAATAYNLLRLRNLERVPDRRPRVRRPPHRGQRTPARTVVSGVTRMMLKKTARSRVLQQPARARRAGWRHYTRSRPVRARGVSSAPSRWVAPMIARGPVRGRAPG